MPMECSTKTKRAKLALELATLFNDAGWTFDYDDHDGELTFRAGDQRGYAVLIHLENGRGSTAFLAHWHTNFNKDVRPTYPVEFPDDVNPYHRAKATTCVWSWALFVGRLRACLSALAPEPVT